ncbi:ADP-ribose pyrophosphatase [Sporocytophaga myxococcoides]|uniref:ADP-ribose pyrophosphatase n=1 Tax=Sporocytophaga myxococcoides TaxID=153721 RepID=A0A098L9K6_9BACT|nr:NUDIX hydrolase [Sporocytophaga myxococcoides]GAL83641.1 ADP-ribose pyrophosphatase [Sporocytophaga myxococcoides]
MAENNKCVQWAIELQAIAQIGLTYSKDIFDHERYQRIREISAEIMSEKSSLNLEVVKDLFCNETGFQTPKLDTRAAIIKEDKILLVRENNEKWSLPGGWVNVNESIKTNIIKEVKEESGYNASPLKIIAIQDRNKHNKPMYAYGVCKVFVLCDIDNSPFRNNIETSERKFFSINEIPELAEEKNTIKQIEICFSAYYDKTWTTLFD